MFKTRNDARPVNYDYTIQDNYICPDTCKAVFAEITHSDFDWHFTRATDYELLEDKATDIHNWQFVHVCDNFGNRTQQSELFQPFIDRIDPDIVYRFKVNFTPINSEIRELGFHTDCKITPGLTSILYLNDCNGKTLLRCPDGVHEVESVAGRLLTFDNRIIHTGTTSTDTHRIVFNLNYYKHDS